MVDAVVLSTHLPIDEEQTYEGEFGSKMYQIEVQLLENTAAYIHVAGSVDDGHFLLAIAPAHVQFHL